LLRISLSSCGSGGKNTLFFREKTLYSSQNQEDQDKLTIQATYHITVEGLNFMKDLNKTRNGKINPKEITLKEAQKAIEITCSEEEPETRKLCEVMMNSLIHNN